MRYNVIWGPHAEQMLAAIWLASRDRASVTQATDVIESHLMRSPLRTGEPMSSSVHRFIWLPPIGVEFEVIEDDKRVIVQAVFAAN